MILHSFYSQRHSPAQDMAGPVWLRCKRGWSKQKMIQTDGIRISQENISWWQWCWQPAVHAWLGLVENWVNCWEMTLTMSLLMYQYKINSISSNSTLPLFYLFSVSILISRENIFLLGLFRSFLSNFLTPNSPTLAFWVFFPCPVW